MTVNIMKRIIPMLFRVNKKVFDLFPNVQLGIIVATNLQQKDAVKKAADLLEQSQLTLRSSLDANQLQEHPFILAWNEAFKKCDINPKKYLSSVQALAGRVVKGNQIKSINPLVDLYNAISLKYLLPLGGEDLAQIKGDVELTVAQKNEIPVSLLGQQELYTPEPGEVFYKDENGAVCCKWNWREASRVKLTENSRDAFFVLEALPPVDLTILTAATNELAWLLQSVCEGTVSYAIVNAQNPQLVIKKDTTFVSLGTLPTKPVMQANLVYSQKQSAAHQEQQEVSGESKIRAEKVQTLRKQGVEPWPENKEVTDSCAQVLKHFGHHDQKPNYTIAGRLVAMRSHGKTAFANLQDASGKLQLYFKEDIVGSEQFESLKQTIDIGDLVWVTGKSFRTKMGEITLEVTQFVLLSKCLHPLPEKFHGLTDVEVRYRQRYLDLISNTESREKFLKRSAIIKSIRTFLDEHNFLEVETPMLHPIAGGAAARPFITHHNALGDDFYLRIAPELYLKRLVVGGFERVYEINRNFRNEGISTRHNPEFTMLEFYWAYHDYHFIMSFVEQLMRFAVEKSCETLQVPFGETVIDFAKPFKRISVKNAVLEHLNIKQDDCSVANIDAQLKKHEIKLQQTTASIDVKLYALFEKLVEPTLVQPTFITEYPIEISPLSKRDPKNGAVAARYELFIGGMEISNGFNELNDPYDQAERFKHQLEAHKAGDPEAHQYDADYVHALEYGLPPTVGVGIGIDRMVMLLTNTTSIKDVILFPTLKKKSDH